MPHYISQKCGQGHVYYCVASLLVLVIGLDENLVILIHWVLTDF